MSMAGGRGDGRGFENDSSKSPAHRPYFLFNSGPVSRRLHQCESAGSDCESDEDTDVDER